MPTDPAETRETLQRLANHVRWLARGLIGDEAAGQLLTYAQELETRAAHIGDGH